MYSLRNVLSREVDVSRYPFGIEGLLRPYNGLIVNEIVVYQDWKGREDERSTVFKSLRRPLYYLCQSFWVVEVRYVLYHGRRKISI